MINQQLGYNTKMEAKLSTQTDEYWLRAEIKEETLSIQLFLFHNEQVKQKLSRDVNLRKDLKELRALKHPEQLLRMMKNPANYEIKSTERMISLKWAITAEGYSFKIVSQIKLNEQKLSEMEALACQNIFLKNQLIKFKQSQSLVQNPNIAEKSLTSSVDNGNFFEIVKARPTELAPNKSKQKLVEKTPEIVKKDNPILNHPFPIQDSSLQQQKQDKMKKHKQIHKNSDKNKKQLRKRQDNEESKEKFHHKDKRKKNGTSSPKKIKRDVSVAGQTHSEAKQFCEKNVRVELGGGDYYYGELKEGKFHGFGVMQSHIHGRHEGNWAEGVADGQGLHYDILGNKYQGMYKNDKRNGHGVEIYINGEKYEGNFANDVKCGFGKYFYCDGDMYEGEWANDVYNGKGKETYANGSIFEGIFKDDEKNEWGIYTDKCGKKFKQLWDFGKLRQQEPYAQGTS